MKINFKNTTIDALSAENPQTRLKAALAIGSVREPDISFIDMIIVRCAIEPDFFVRDMLTWSLTRYSPEIIVPRLIAELGSEIAQARSQALHTLSKLKDRSAFPAITQSLMRDKDDNVAQSAWRAAVALVPDDRKTDLAEVLSTQFGRGNSEMQLSLSRALVSLGAEIIEHVLQKAMYSNIPKIRAHASATKRLLVNPDSGFEISIYEAKKQYALKDRPI